MEGKFITKLQRFGYAVAGMMLSAGTVGMTAHFIRNLYTRGAPFWLVGIFFTAGAAVLYLLIGFAGGKERISVKQGKVQGEYRSEAFRFAVGEIRFASAHWKWLYLRTDQKRYIFWGLQNADELFAQIGRELPLSDGCRSMTDDALQQLGKERGKDAAKAICGGLGLIILGILSIYGVFLADFGALSPWLDLAVVVIAFAVTLFGFGIMGKGHWKRLGVARIAREITRRKIGNVDDYPAGYTDVVKVIYQEDYAFRIIVRHTQEGYVCVDEFWNDELDPPAWESDEEDVDLGDLLLDVVDAAEKILGDDEDEDEDEDADHTPKVFQTMKELDEYLEEEWSIFTVDEIVYFE